MTGQDIGAQAACSRYIFEVSPTNPVALLSLACAVFLVAAFTIIPRHLSGSYQGYRHLLGPDSRRLR